MMQKRRTYAARTVRTSDNTALFVTGAFAFLITGLLIGQLLLLIGP